MQLWNLISENQHLSFRICERFEGVPTWNAELEVLYVLEGNDLSCTVGDRTYRLNREDFIVFNPYEIHSISAENCRTLSLFIFPTLLNLKSGMQWEDRIFCCSADLSAPQEWYQGVRRLIANILLMLCQEARLSEYQIYGDALDLLGVFEENFLVKKRRPAGRGQNVVEHLQRVVRYMDENYMENLTLTGVAKTEYLSTNYLSHLFRSYLRTSFVQYLRMLRLNHAYADLINTDLSITEIAMKNGFASATVFIRYFGDVYGKTPAKFRKSREAKQYYQHPTPDEDDAAFFALTRHATYVIGQTAYLRKNIENRDIVVDCTKRGLRRPQTWNRLMNVGWAKEALLAPVQQQITRTREELGFRMIRFHGIFDYDMYIYNVDENGEVFYNFGYLEMLLDYFVSNELCPFIEFGFIPPALASDGRAYYNHFSYICLPNDLGRWTALVEATLRHCINRYGIKEVLRWRFTLFNSVYVYYGCISEDDWWTLWQRTYTVLKSVHRELCFGLNDDLGLFGSQYTRFWDYLEQGMKSGCAPDFLSLQCFYGDYYATGDLAFGKVYTQKEMPLPHSADENYLTHKLDELYETMCRYHAEQLPVWFEAWNSTVWQRDSCNDGCFKSAFIVKNILENEGRLEAFGHWTLSDFMEEVPHNPAIFHGGYGILTYNGIPKPGYYAMQMLYQLGDGCIGRGDGWYVTCDGEDIKLLLYHYYHYDLLYQRHYSLKSDGIFKFQNSISFRICLKHMAPGNYTVTTQSISQENGSSYDTWLYMGAPDRLTFAQLEYIKQVSKPRIETHIESIGESYLLETKLRSHEVQLITIHRMH